jgi:hypothetical protein
MTLNLFDCCAGRHRVDLVLRPRRENPAAGGLRTGPVQRNSKD